MGAGQEGEETCTAAHTLAQGLIKIEACFFPNAALFLAWCAGHGETGLVTSLASWQRLESSAGGAELLCSVRSSPCQVRCGSPSTGRGKRVQYCSLMSFPVQFCSLRFPESQGKAGTARRL